MTTSTFDRAGVAISALCILHCVLLPLTTSILPMMGLLAENELIHKALVFLAIIPAIFAFTGFIVPKFSAYIRGLGILGVLVLFAGAFVEPLHDYETSLTVMGALSLASAHILRSKLNKPHHHKN